MTATPEERLEEMGITLPTQSPTALISATDTVQAHVDASIQYVDPLIVTSQTASVGAEGRFLGRYGENLSVADGYEAARLAGINALGELRLVLGSLSRIRHLMMLTCYTVCTPNFTQVAQITNGASDLFYRVLGPVKGKHARASIAVQGLPGGASVEIVLWAAVTIEAET